MAKTKAKATTVFARRPDDGDLALRWQVTRVGVRPLKGIVILSHDVEGSYTHYAQGRTQPCPEPKIRCSLCASGAQRRWYGYLAICDLKGQGRSLLEVTHNSVRAIDEYFRSHRTLRGATLEMWRSPAKPNGKLHSRCSESTVLADGLPEAPNLREILNRMWKVAVLAAIDEELERDLRIAYAAQDVG